MMDTTFQTSDVHSWPLSGDYFQPFEDHLTCLRVVEPSSRFGHIDEHHLLQCLLAPHLGKTKAVSISKRLIAHFGSALSALLAPSSVIAEGFGLDESVIHMLDLVRRMALCFLQGDMYKSPMLKPSTAANFLVAILGKQRTEQMWALYLGTDGRLIALERLFKGTTSSCVIYPREIVAGALNANAVAVILAHNHPSGNPTPSKDDVLATDAAIRALKSLDIVLFDHLIVGNGCWVSLRDSGLFRNYWKSTAGYDSKTTRSGQPTVAAARIRLKRSYPIT